MYTEYWQLESQPFGPTLDRRFYYPSETHQGAVLKLRYAVESGAAAAVLAGRSGMGKTLLVSLLREQLPESTSPIIHVVFPQMSRRDLLVYLAEQFRAPAANPPRHTVEESIRRIELVFRENARIGRHAVIVVDEADLLDEGETLETLRLLINISWKGRPCCTLLLVGQMGLLSILARRPSLEERIAVKALLRPFSMEDTVAYLQHLLEVAGATRQLFDQSALEKIHHLSLGVPRSINRLADLSLLIGYAEDLATITAKQIESVSSELITLAAA
ncbi:MAG: AAA family ATPase [Pirellulales bacterium]|nr:AAA family ATPase [Pirellulales bacterium]